MGRPKGSKNKVKTESAVKNTAPAKVEKVVAKESTSGEVPKRRGRPPGSKNKSAEPIATPTKVEPTPEAKPEAPAPAPVTETKPVEVKEVTKPVEQKVQSESSSDVPSLSWLPNEKYSTLVQAADMFYKMMSPENRKKFDEAAKTSPEPLTTPQLRIASLLVYYFGITQESADAYASTK